MIDLERRADRLLHARSYAMYFSEVFEPFKVLRNNPRRLNGPVPDGCSCRNCGGPRTGGTELCAGCVQHEAVAAVEEYWRRLQHRREPDFARGLIELIHERELQIGPAARWPKEETVVIYRRTL